MMNPFYADWFIETTEQYLLHADQKIIWLSLDGVGQVPSVRSWWSKRVPYPVLKNMPSHHCFCGEPLPVKVRGEHSPHRDIYLKLVPEDSPAHLVLENMPGAYRVGSRSRACLRHGMNYSTFFASNFTGKKRGEIRRQERRLNELGKVEEQWWQPTEDLEEWVDQFIALEAMSWKKDRGTAFACSDAETQFLYDITKQAASRDILLFYRKMVDNAPVAMTINFRTDGTIYNFKIAHSPAYAKYSPGVQAVLAISQRMLEDETIQLMDSCAAEDHPMLNHLWPDRRQLNDWYVPQTLLGRFLIAPLLKIRYQKKMRVRKELYVGNQVPSLSS